MKNGSNVGLVGYFMFKELVSRKHSPKMDQNTKAGFYLSARKLIFGDFINLYL